MGWRKKDDGNTLHMLSGWVEVLTARALLLHSDFMEEPIWLPISQIGQIEDLNDGDLNRVEVWVKYWLIQKNGYA